MKSTNFITNKHSSRMLFFFIVQRFLWNRNCEISSVGFQFLLRNMSFSLTLSFFSSSFAHSACFRLVLCSTFSLSKFTFLLELTGCNAKNYRKKIGYNFNILVASKKLRSNCMWCCVSWSLIVFAI